MSSQKALNINEASKACGLSPSVLRIWELRYGWPSPKRKPNGYRSYNHHQVQELKRMADLVKSGHSISSLIVDGLPRWPANNPNAGKYSTLPSTRALPQPQDRRAQDLRQDLLEALESRRGSQVNEVLQRAIWLIRSADESQVTLLPTVVGLAELRRADRLPRDAEDVLAVVEQRCEQLLRSQRSSDESLLVVPLTSSAMDRAMAALAAVMLTQRGHPAKVWTQEIPHGAQVLTVSDDDSASSDRLGENVIGRISALGDNDTMGLPELLNSEIHLLGSSV
jgi:DNA-binding transcriptional MerR regulator